MFEDLSSMVVADYEINKRRSLDRAQRALEHARRYFGDVPAVEITTDRITSYIRSRKGEGAMAASIQYELAMLKRGFSLAVRAERLSRRPYIPSIQWQNTRTGFVEAEQFRKILDSLPEDIRPPIEFAFAEVAGLADAQDSSKARAKQTAEAVWEARWS